MNRAETIEGKIIRALIDDDIDAALELLRGCNPAELHQLHEAAHDLISLTNTICGGHFDEQAKTQ